MAAITPTVFVFGVLLILFSPGPTNTLLAASGAMVGVRRSLPLVLAEVSGYLTTIVIVGFLVKRWVLAAPGAAPTLRLAAAAYLIFVAISTLRSRPAQQENAVSLQRLFVATLLNPKGLIFSLVLIPTERPEGPVYIAAFAAMVLVAGSCWVCIGSTLGRIAGRAARSMIPKIASAVLCCFGAGLIVSVLAR
jgi:threonine/homoserine/homoserine lactone efflux protein